MKGTWQTTGGGDSGSAVAMAAIVGAVFLFGGGAMAAVAAAVTELIITVAIIIGVLVVAAAVLLVWWVRRMPVREARARAVYAAQVEAYEDGKRRAALERHQRALELARASAPVIQNVIDPAAILAADAWQPRQPEPVRVLRGEVERLWASGSPASRTGGTAVTRPPRHVTRARLAHRKASPSVSTSQGRSSARRPGHAPRGSVPVAAGTGLCARTSRTDGRGRHPHPAPAAPNPREPEGEHDDRG